MIKLNSVCQEDTESSVTREENQNRSLRDWQFLIPISSYSLLCIPRTLGSSPATPSVCQRGKNSRLSTTSELNVPRVTSKQCPCLEMALSKHSSCLILSLHLNSWRNMCLWQRIPSTFPSSTFLPKFALLRLLLLGPFRQKHSEDNNLSRKTKVWFLCFLFTLSIGHLPSLNLCKDSAHSVSCPCG